MSKLEAMAEFFAARVEGYDSHMINEVEGCKEGYELMARLIPENAETLLDLGCGTGLELDEIFKMRPSIKVVGIDLCREMLDKLKQKHQGRDITLICGDYFKEELGKKRFDCAVSFETMHHFSKESKTALYKRICDCLADGGTYIECDYMVKTQEEEDHWFAENERLRSEAGAPMDGYFHYDTPCTVDNQIMMLKSAGFKNVENVFEHGGTVMIIAKK